MSLRTTKVMTAAEAVEQFVADGAVVGLGGLSIARQPVALASEVVRQGKKDLTIVGCSLNLPMDMLVGSWPGQTGGGRKWEHGAVRLRLPLARGCPKR